MRCRALQMPWAMSIDGQQAMEGQALGRVDAERDHSRGRNRSASTLASASPAILCGSVCIVSFIHPREDGLTLPQRSTWARDTTDQQG